MIKSGQPELGAIGSYLLNKKAIETVKDFKNEEITVVDDGESLKISNMLKKIQGKERVLARVHQYSVQENGGQKGKKPYSLSVPQNAHVFSIKDQIRSKFAVDPKESIVVFVNNEVLHNFMSMKEVYAKYGKNLGYVNMLFINLTSITYNLIQSIRNWMTAKEVSGMTCYAVGASAKMQITVAQSELPIQKIKAPAEQLSKDHLYDNDARNPHFEIEIKTSNGVQEKDHKLTMSKSAIADFFAKIEEIQDQINSYA